MTEEYKPSAGEHPITPPPGLVQQWCHEDGDEIKTSPRWFQSVCAKAAQWGADQELEACAKWVEANFGQLPTHNLHQFRRPKPPSLKEQALEQLECIQTDLNKFGMGISTDTIRRALEQLPDAL